MCFIHFVQLFLINKSIIQSNYSDFSKIMFCFLGMIVCVIKVVVDFDEIIIFCDESICATYNIIDFLDDLN